MLGYSTGPGGTSVGQTRAGVVELVYTVGSKPTAASMQVRVLSPVLHKPLPVDTGHDASNVVVVGSIPTGGALDNLYLTRYSNIEHASAGYLGEPKWL